MTSRRALRRLRARIATGDRAGALRDVDAMLVQGVRPVPREQLLFPVVRFTCPRLHVEMAVRECLETRGSVWASGGRKGAPKRHECKGCETGEAFAWACPGIQLRPPQDPPAVMPQSQRMAKRAMALVDPAAAWPSDDPLKIAASMTPDDLGDWR